MSDLIGRCSTLPGTAHALPDGAVCDEHPARPAVARIQGETDSFGAELIDVCAECLNAIKVAGVEERHGVCDWCGTLADDLRWRRDWEEGPGGPVYRVCGGCVKRENDSLREEREEWDIVILGDGNDD